MTRLTVSYGAITNWRVISRQRRRAAKAACSPRFLSSSTMVMCVCRQYVNAPPAKAGSFRLGLKTGSIGPSTDSLPPGPRYPRGVEGRGEGIGAQNLSFDLPHPVLLPLGEGTFLCTLLSSSTTLSLRTFQIHRLKARGLQIPYRGLYRTRSRSHAVIGP